MPLPKAKCGGCGEFMSPVEAAKCSSCLASYHRACVAIPAAGTVSPAWRCPECKKDIIRDNKADNPVRGRVVPSVGLSECAVDVHISPSSIPSIGMVTYSQQSDMALLILEELRAIPQDFFDFCREMAEMKISLQSCQEKIGNLESRADALEKSAAQQVADPASLAGVVEQLRCDLNERDQELLANDVEINNFPEQIGENPCHLVCLFASKVGVALEERDIVSAERVGGRRLLATNAAGPREARPRPLVVRLARRDLRDELLQSARTRCSVNTADMGMTAPPTRFYINERLTKLNRQLFRRVRDAGHRQSWQFVWTKRGRILARSKPGDAAHSFRTFRTDADVLRIFGPEL